MSVITGDYRKSNHVMFFDPKTIDYIDAVFAFAYPQTIRRGKGKGKAVPLQAWTGPEGSRKLRLPDFVTTVQDGGRL